jgi:hypothetical protein
MRASSDSWQISRILYSNMCLIQIHGYIAFIVKLPSARTLLVYVSI